MGGLFVQVAGVLISVVILQGQIFSRLTGYVGLVVFGLDFLHILVGPFAAEAGFILMAVSGPLYLLSFPIVGLRLYRLGNRGGMPIS